MSQHKEHSQSRVAAYVRRLRQCDAPQSLIDDFLDLVAIDDGIATEPNGSLESLDRLLLDACRKFNFAKPFDSEHGKAWFRPNQINHQHPDHRSDIYHSSSGEAFDPGEEQAYRRGFSHGFEDAKSLIKSDYDAVAQREREIHNWRFAKVWFGPTRPGTVEPFGLKISIRSSLPAKLRWQILERDGRRCVACGHSARDGATLHVDHIVSIYNGGENDSGNLQTLCDICNLGKGKD